MITGSDIFLDTNILVYYTFKDFDPIKHLECRETIDKLRNANIQISISTQVLREFYAVVTGKKYFKSPLEPKVAKEQVISFSTQFNVLDINQDVLSQLIILIEKYEIRGQQVHDATIAAAMLTQSYNTLLSYNKKDFAVFQEINTIAPPELLT